jgi:V/A-type H+-transporting ATPase subunit E
MVNNRRSRRDTPVEVASGVEELIARLRDEGVQNGRTQAEQMVRDAQVKAEATVKQAQEQAKQIVSKAREEADNLKRAGHEALELAFRDTVLALKTQLSQRFAGEVRRLVGGEQQKQELLEKMILEIAGREKEEVAQSQQLEVLLPPKVAGLGELSRNPEELEQGILTQFVRLISQGMVREGVSFGVAKDNQGGLRVRLVDKQVVLDLTDRAVADAILEHLQPRFRALLEGVVK